MAGLRRHFPSWVVLLFGVLVGVSLTTTVTFHLQWCAAISTIESREGRAVRVPAAMPLPVTQTQVLDRGCVCGKELEALEKRAAMAGEARADSSLSAVGPPSRDDLPLVADAGILRNHTMGSPHHHNLEHTVGGLVVGVLSRLGHPEWVESVYKTWGQDIADLVLFVGDNFDYAHPSGRGLPLVRLPGVHTEGAVGGASMMMSALHYLGEHYLPSHQWFMLATDNLYVRIDQIEKILSQLNPMEMLYLGRSATGKKEQAQQLGLKPHERYCLGNSGVVLSSALLAKLRSHIAVCLRGSKGVPEDVGLGKCISAALRIQCTQSEKARLYFFEDYSGQPVTLDYVSQKSEVFSNLAAYHPVPSQSVMGMLHRHYKQLQFASLLDSIHSVKKQLTDMCEFTGGGGGDSSPSLSPFSPTTNCTPPTLCPGSKCPNAGVVTTLPTPYQPTGIHDYQPWVYFDAVTLYPDRDTYPTYRMKSKKNYRQELKQMLAKALQKLSERHGRPLKFKKLVNGWVRHSPFMGNEYIVDCLLLDSGRKYISKRINLVRPLATNYITRKDNTSPTHSVNMVVPLTNVNHRFNEFMDMYEQLALVKAEGVKLILSVYGQQDVAVVTRVVDGYRARYPHADIKIVEGRGEFSRGKALHAGVSHLAPDELIFICDVDMRIEQPFLERCRKNTIINKRVYYPEFFKLYNMNYVYWNEQRPRDLSLRRNHGHWAYYSFGMLCIYKSDYTAVGGMDTNIHGWGDEDVRFFNSVVRKRLEVLRAPDKALSHRWHEKHCPKSLPKEQYKHCLSSQAENLADRKELARYIQQVGAEIKGSVEGAAADLASNATAGDDQEYDYGGG